MKSQKLRLVGDLTKELELHKDQKDYFQYGVARSNEYS
jgi:hypothetical protein